MFPIVQHLLSSDSSSSVAVPQIPLGDTLDPSAGGNAAKAGLPIAAREDIKAGNATLALSEFREVEKRDPANPKWRACIGGLLIAGGEIDAGVTELQNAGNLGSIDMVRLSRVAQANIGALKEGDHYLHSNDYRNDHYWSVYQKLISADIPGTGNILDYMRDEIDEIASVRDHVYGSDYRPLRNPDWVPRAQWAKGHPRGPKSGFESCF